MIAKDKLTPALDRQIAEMERHRKRGDSDAGVWKFAGWRGLLCLGADARAPRRR
jgi:uncharacterized protein (DUF885 family)